MKNTRNDSNWLKNLLEFETSNFGKVNTQTYWAERREKLHDRLEFNIEGDSLISNYIYVLEKYSTHV